jgi:hypothetical protein
MMELYSGLSEAFTQDVVNREPLMNGRTSLSLVTLMVSLSIFGLFNPTNDILGSKLWGRGSCDDKSVLIGILYVHLSFTRHNLA